jgi:hypothetical protein
MRMNMSPRQEAILRFLTTLLILIYDNFSPLPKKSLLAEVRSEGNNREEIKK